MTLKKRLDLLSITVVDLSLLNHNHYLAGGDTEFLLQVWFPFNRLSAQTGY